MPAERENPNRWKKFAIVLTLVNTFLAALIVGLEVDASLHANGANRDSQYLAVKASGSLMRSGLQSNYDLATFATMVKNAQEALVLGFTALDPELENDPALAKLQTQAAAAQARADMAQALSLFYTDPRYAPTSPDGFPDLAVYLEDMLAESQELVDQQNAAAEEYARWDKKSDNYIAVLTLLAIAFFLLGLTQTLTPEPRLLLAFIALGLMSLGSLWTMVNLLS